METMIAIADEMLEKANEAEGGHLVVTPETWRSYAERIKKSVEEDPMRSAVSALHARLQRDAEAWYDHYLKYTYWRWTKKAKEAKKWADVFASLRDQCAAAIDGRPTGDSKKPGGVQWVCEVLEDTMKFISNLEIEPDSSLDEDASELRNNVVKLLYSLKPLLAEEDK